MTWWMWTILGVWVGGVPHFIYTRNWFSFVLTTLAVGAGWAGGFVFGYGSAHLRERSPK